MNTPTDCNAAAYQDYCARLTAWRAADPATRGPVPEYGPLKAAESPSKRPLKPSDKPGAATSPSAP